MTDLNKESSLDRDINRILIVDDSLPNRFLMCKVLEDMFGTDFKILDESRIYGGVETHVSGRLGSEYYSVAFVEDGYKARRILVDGEHVRDIDLILLDNNMPGPLGIDIIVSLKERGLPTKRVALYSDSACEKLRSRVLDHGALHYPKPKDPTLDALNQSLSFALGVMVPYFGFVREDYPKREGHA